MIKFYLQGQLGKGGARGIAVFATIFVCLFFSSSWSKNLEDSEKRQTDSVDYKSATQYIKIFNLPSGKYEVRVKVENSNDLRGVMSIFVLRGAGKNLIFQDDPGLFFESAELFWPGYNYVYTAWNNGNSGNFLTVYHLRGNVAKEVLSVNSDYYPDVVTLKNGHRAMIANERKGHLIGEDSRYAVTLGDRYTIYEFMDDDKLIKHQHVKLSDVKKFSK
jgi:hypothetical protein